MTEAIVQTSALADEPDMFGDTGAASPACADLVVEIHAVLASAAEVRSMPIGDGTQMRPVLCLDVVPVNRALRRRMHVVQIYTEATRKDAEARAAVLKRGTHITFRTTLVDSRIVFPHVLSVDLSPSPTTP